MSSFLPEMERANAELEERVQKEGKESVSIENTGDEGEHIAMVSCCNMNFVHLGLTGRLAAGCANGPRGAVRLGQTSAWRGGG